MKKTTLPILLLALSIIFPCGFSFAQNITTIAGGGNHSGENRPDSVAQITPYAIAFDTSGNLYMCDIDHNVIRKKDAATGFITTIAGTGAAGYSGDGGPATAATINYPAYIVVDTAGNIYFSDMLNLRVRCINTSGVITTIAGNGVGGFNGDGIAATASNLDPTGLAIGHSGNLIIGDRSSSRIRSVSGGIITTIAGTGTYGYSGDGGPATAANRRTPEGIATNKAGEIYFTDNNSNKVRKISTSGIITLVAGNGSGGHTGDGGPATNAAILADWGITTDTFGNVFLTDNEYIRKISPSGIITGYAGHGSTPSYSGDGGPATAAYFNGPIGITTDISGNLFIADHSNFVVRKVSVAGIITSIAGNNFPEYTGDRGPAVDAVMYPSRLHFDTAGNLYFVDDIFRTLRKISPAGIVTRVAGYGLGSVGTMDDGKKATLAHLAARLSAAFDKKGNIYIADWESYLIRKIDTAGIMSTIAGNGTSGFSGDSGPSTAARIWRVHCITTDTSGNLYFADYGNNRVRKISTSGIITTIAGTGYLGSSGNGGPATNALLAFPREVALDKFGNVYIGDDSNRIRKVNTSGIISAFAGTGIPGYSGDGGPATAANITYGEMNFDSHGNMLLCQRNNVVRKIDTAGVITTFAGTGVAGFSGDGGPATNARFWLAYGTQTDQWGNVYIADDSNGRIRFVCANDTIVDAVGITASTTAICAGQPVTFSATDTNAGPSPFYQWVINGTNVSGATTNTFTSTTLSNTDTVWCEMTGNNPAPCAINNRDTSNKIVIAVTPVSPTPSVISVSATPPSIAYLGQPIIFNATITGGGSSPVLQWYKNGIAIAGGTTNPYTSTTINPGDIVLLSVHTSNPCASPDSARSATITMPSTIGVNTPSAINEKISLYPNPNDGSFSLKGSLTGSREYAIEITDPVGKVIYQNVVSTTNNNLDTTIKLNKKTTPGLYFIRIQSGDAISTYRFMVK